MNRLVQRRNAWNEQLDELINQLHDLGLPGPVTNTLVEKLEEVAEEVQSQFELQSTDW